MKRFTFAALLLVLITALPAQAQSNWLSLVTMKGTKIFSVQGATRIDVPTAKAMHEKGLLFVDAQGFFEWKRSHIPGALLGASITEAELAEIADKDKAIVFYCDCVVGSATCNLSPTASAKAVSWGYSDIYYFTNYGDWISAGYSTENES